jgi:NADH:ubiquinone oxidoreductase subunit 5 (subunit L)/multisubunit Na+/H+ antiporter MnhA subunit
MNKLGGLVGKMPFTGFFFMIGSVAICALPPFNGFVSEFMIYMGFLESSVSNSALFLAVSTFSIAMLSFAGAVALLCFVKAFSSVFLGHPRTELPEAASEVGLGMTVPMGFLASLCLLIGLFPSFVLKLASKPVEILSGAQFPENTGIFSALNGISLAFFIMIAVFCTLVILKKLLLKNRKRTIMPTWGCGYKKANSRMQYTPTSFSMPFLDIASPLLKRKADSKLPSGVFPVKSFAFTRFLDIFETHVFKPFAHLVRRLVSMFLWIQNGSMQQYLFYGLCFLVLAILWVLLGGRK